MGAGKGVAMYAGMVLDAAHQVLEQSGMGAADLLHARQVGRTPSGKQQVGRVANDVAHTERVGEPAECACEGRPVAARPRTDLPQRGTADRRRNSRTPGIPPASPARADASTPSATTGNNRDSKAMTCWFCQPARSASDRNETSSNAVIKSRAGSQSWANCQRRPSCCLRARITIAAIAHRFQMT